MKTFPIVLALTCVMLVCSCRNRTEGGKPISGRPEAGALYSLSDGEGGYRVGKVVAVDEVVFVRLFGERWTKRPAALEAQKISRPMTLAYSFETLAGMQPVFLNRESVTPEELESYEQWKRSSRDVF